MRQRRLGWLWIAGMMLCCAAAANGQTPEGPVYGVRQELPKFSIDTPHGYLDLNGTWTSDQTSGKDSRTHSTDLLLEEQVHLETTGYIMHPNLVELNLQGTLGLTQDSFSGTDGSQDSNNTLYEWNATARILRNQYAPLTLYTSRSQSFVNQSFGPTLQSTATLYGADWAIRSKTAPTEFRIFHSDESQSGIGTGQQDYSITREGFEWHTQARLTENQVLNWNYRIETSDQNGSNGISESVNSQSASLNHSLLFGPTRNYTLASSASYSDTTGVFPLKNMRWDEDLRLQHSQNFETEYQYTAEQQTFQDLESTRQRATAGFRHKLYKSLTTIGRVGVQQVDQTDDSTTKDYFADLDFLYTKKVPYGQLDADLRLNFDRQDNGERLRSIPVVDQSLSFIDFTPRTITEPSIVSSSVLLRNAVTGEFFLPGNGYTVLPVPNGIQITPLPGAPIGVGIGQPLLLSYDLAAMSANEVTTQHLSTGLRYNIQQGWLKGLSPYGRFSMTDQSVTGGAGVIQPDSTRDYVVGADYRIGDLFFRAEQEKFDSQVLPYDATRLSAQWNHRLNPSSTITLNGTYTSVDYSLQDNQFTTESLTGAFTERLTQSLSVTASVSWVNLEDNHGNSTRGLEEAIEGTWWYRQIQVYGRVRNASLNTNEEDRMFQFLQFGIRREF